MRTIIATAAALLLLATGCSSGEQRVAADPAPTSASITPTPTPTASPTVGTYPHFAPQDYRFTLQVTCFCLDPGPVQVTVAGGAVVSATYLGGGGGKGGETVEPGTPADLDRAMTIDDVIDAANDTTAARVDVDWPVGQDFPSSVSVDQDLQMADEEVTYLVGDVLVAPR